MTQWRLVIQEGGERITRFSPVAQLAGERDRTARLVLWLGLLFPLVVDTVRTRDQILARDLSPVELLRGAVPIVCFMIGVLLARPRVRPVTRTELAFGLFLGVAVASTAWSVVRWATLVKAGSLVVAYLTILAIARLDERRGGRSLDGLGLAILLVVGLALVQLAVAPRAVMIPVDGPGAPLRLQGVLPAVAADLLGFLAAVAVLLLLEGSALSWIRGRWVRAALIAACLLVLVLTRARAATGLMALGLALLYGRRLLTLFAALPSGRRRLLIAAATALAAGVVALAAVEPAWLVSLVTRGQDPRHFLSLTGRTVTWGDALAQWVHRPLLGYGYYAGHRFAIPVRPGWGNLQNLDSMWVETLLDIGLVGLVGLVLAVASAAYDLARPRAEDAHLGVRRVTFVIGLLASFINPSLQAYTYPMVVLAFVCLGAPRLSLRR